MAGQAAHGQTTNAPLAASDSGSTTNVTKLENVTVFGKLDQARNQIVPDLGATVYAVSKDQIAAQPQGENAPFNQVLLRAPGMAQDSAANGDLHLRGEHANIQYRINDVLLPEGISGFGQELDTRFVDSLRLITGSLPAQYGFRTAGVVDLQTKSGAFEPGGEGSVYGGSYDTIDPSFEYGGSKGNLNYFMDGSYDHNGIGIENPTPSSTPLHDTTDQYKAFTYLSYVLDDTSRISVMGSASYSSFQIPNTPGLPAGTAGGGTNWNSFLPATTFNSADLNENQNEQNYYGVVAYQKSAGNLNLQVAAYGRSSSVHFTPDPLGDLFFNGVASDVDRSIYSGGLQADASYALGDKHTLRGGIMLLEEVASTHATTTVFPVDSLDPSVENPNGLPEILPDNVVAHAMFVGLYLQDEWKILPKVTLNYGARFDLYYASFDKENQPSPRVNLIYQPTDATTLHAGYARYFTPPPLENVPSETVNLFRLTSNESAPGVPDDAVKAERANYFDAGISQKLAPGLQVGVDGYYKNAVNQLDDGLFGQTLILSAFNYAEGRIYGVEFTGTYAKGGFSTYANLAYSVAQGLDWNSAQFLFDPGDLAYVRNHWIYLDHDQRVTGSFGASYLFHETQACSARVYVDALYGSGLRQDGGGFEPDNPAAPIPNGATVPAYYSVSLGAEQDWKVARRQILKARLDVVNVTDNIYQLRSGSGVGVNAAQYGMRLGFFGTLSYAF
jgi:outer membrane receptor protein involved in Fe transport